MPSNPTRAAELRALADRVEARDAMAAFEAQRMMPWDRDNLPPRNPMEDYRDMLMFVPDGWVWDGVRQTRGDGWSAILRKKFGADYAPIVATYGYASTEIGARLAAALRAHAWEAEHGQ